MQLRNRTCSGCNSVFEVATGRKIQSANPDFYRQKGLCEECFKDVREFVDVAEKKIIRDCKDVAWASEKS